MEIKIYRNNRRVNENNKFSNTYYFKFKWLGIWHIFTSYNYDTTMKNKSLNTSLVVLFNFEPKYFFSVSAIENFLNKYKTNQLDEEEFIKKTDI